MVAETFDGVRLTVEAGTFEERTFLRLSAEFDPGLVVAETTEALLDETAARAEVDALTDRWRGWAYEIAGYTLNNLRKKVEDMVKPIEEEEPPGPAPGAFPAPAYE